MDEAPPEVTAKLSAPLLALMQRLDDVYPGWVSFSVRRETGYLLVQVYDETDVQ